MCAVICSLGPRLIHVFRKQKKCYTIFRLDPPFHHNYHHMNYLNRFNHRLFSIDPKSNYFKMPSAEMIQSVNDLYIFLHLVHILNKQLLLSGENFCNARENDLRLRN